MTPSRRTIVLAAVLAAIALFPAAAELRVQSGSRVIADGATWNIPMNSAGSKVALFSEQREPFSLRNDGGAAVRVSSIEVEPAGGVMAEEFSLQNTELVPGPLDFSPTEVAAGGSFDFYVRFYPVQSGERRATVTVTYGGGERTSFQVTGRGRDDARFTGAFSTAATRLFGGRETDEMVTGMAADAQGNVFRHLVVLAPGSFLVEVVTVKTHFEFAAARLAARLYAAVEISFRRDIANARHADPCGIAPGHVAPAEIRSVIANGEVVVAELNVVSNVQIFVTIAQPFVCVIVIAELEAQSAGLRSFALSPAGDPENAFARAVRNLARHNMRAANLVAANVPSAGRRLCAVVLPGLEIV